MGTETRTVAPSRFRDMPLVAGVVRKPYEVNGDVSGAWCVIVDDAQSVLEAVPPGGTASVASTPGNGGGEEYRLVVVHPESVVVHALTTWAFEQLEAHDGPVAVVVADGERVCGVWAGEHLQEVLAFGVPLSAHPTLAGDPHIPQIIRRCGYREGDESCRVVRRFSSYPQRMPRCESSALAVHTFVW
ncbi:hypothetical protein ACFWWT_45820 [Streptomyces sp. NPDC058676]|uniref:hypothetical protein n=1 Tax=unclassified Streptomyces TaxID=2593676 RepID=UPI003657B812